MSVDGYFGDAIWFDNVLVNQFGDAPLGTGPTVGDCRAVGLVGWLLFVFHDGSSFGSCIGSVIGSLLALGMAHCWFCNGSVIGTDWHSSGTLSGSLPGTSIGTPVALFSTGVPTLRIISAKRGDRGGGGQSVWGRWLSLRWQIVAFRRPG